MEGSESKLFIRVSREWVQQLASRMAEEEIQEVEIRKSGEDGRIILRQVEQKEVLKPFALTKREPKNGGTNGQGQTERPVQAGIRAG